MKSSRIKNNITYFFIVLFLSTKIAGLHSLTHTDDKDHDTCAICDYAVVCNVTPTLTPDLNDFEIENIEIIIQKEVLNNYNFILLKKIVSQELFSRPPPFLV